MKNIILLLFFPVFAIAQTKTVTLSETRIGKSGFTGSVHCYLEQTIDLENLDTSSYIYIGFQNARYTAIVDSKSLYFPCKDTASINQFVKDLKMALTEIGGGSVLTWTRDKYEISTSGNGIVYIYEDPTNGTGFTFLRKRQINSLIDWFGSIGYSH